MHCSLSTCVLLQYEEEEEEEEKEEFCKLRPADKTNHLWHIHYTCHDATF